MKSPRAAAFDVLFPFEKKGKEGAHRLKADQLIDGVLNSVHWDERDRRFFTQLVYGVLRQWFVLNAMIKVHKPLKALEPKVRCLLRLGLYQKHWMDSVPDYAAVDATLELAQKKRVATPAKGLINAILHADTKPSDAYFPDWWQTRMQAQFSDEQLAVMAKISQQPAPLSLRVNTLKTSIAEFQDALIAADITTTQPEPELPEIFVLNEFVGSPKNLPGYAEGWFAVQDPSSAMVAQWVDPQPHEIILDLCAAPGSKTTHMAALMKNQGQIIAVEPVQVRLERLQENLTRLGITNVQTQESTAEQFNPGETRFDKILVDAPCSGTGTIRKHPEILIQLVEAHITDYTKRQLSILESAVPWLKPNGEMIYSTCSLDHDENRGVIAQFLKRHPEFKLIKDEQRLITEFGDGFYLANMFMQNN